MSRKLLHFLTFIGVVLLILSLTLLILRRLGILRLAETDHRAASLTGTVTQEAIVGHGLVCMNIIRQVDAVLQFDVRYPQTVYSTESFIVRAKVTVKNISVREGCEVGSYYRPLKERNLTSSEK